MSLLSDFGDSGFVGGADCGVQVLRMQNLTGQLVYNSAYSGSFNFKDTGTQAFQYADVNPSSTSSRISVVKFDFANKTSQFYGGPTKVAATTNDQKILGNPFGGWLMYKPGVAPAYMHYTTDGNTYVNTNQESSIDPFFSTRFGGGWFDGTTFAYANIYSQFVYTTNGTSFSTTSIGGASANPVWGKNNYSPYSGYWFYAYSGGYGYKTSVTGGGTNVAGYRLTAMSANGRYLMRRNNTSYSEEYSTDGGASWSSFSVPIPQENGYDSGGGVSRVASNSGQFFTFDAYGSKIYCYDFSSSVWRVSATLFIAGSSTALQAATSLYIEGVEALHIAIGGTSNTYIVDMPKGFN